MEAIVTGKTKKIMEEPPKPGKGGLLPGEAILTAEEARLLTYFRTDLKWGVVTVEVKNGRPVMLRNIRQDVKLDEPFKG